MLLTPSFYAHATHTLMGLANGKVCVVLEGGYCIESLADGVSYTIRTLLGDPPVPLRMRYPINETVISTILDVISVHRPYWNCLRFQRTFNRHDNEIDDDNQRKRHYPMIEYRGQLELLPNKPETYPTRDCYPVQSDETKSRYLNAIETLRTYADNQYVSYDDKRTCIIQMISAQHNAGGTHPERPSRVQFLWKFLKTNNILERCLVINNRNRMATIEQIGLCHSMQAIMQVRSTETMSNKELRVYESKLDSIYCTEDTFSMVRLAIGSLLQVVDCVMRNECLNGFAAIRPPGHHASRNSPAGFCFFNNVAIAAHYAIEQYNLKRILILDWDIHHGDGMVL